MDRAPPMSGGRRERLQEEDELTLADVKKYIHFVVIRIEHVLLDLPSAAVDQLNDSGNLSGFKLSYKLPRAARGNSSLDREVLVNGSCALPEHGRRVEVILFKHKKVFPVELDTDLIVVWNRSALEVSLSMVTSSAVRSGIVNDRKNTKVIARASVALSDLLVPPFVISRDCVMSGVDFTGRVSISIELGSRNSRIAERLVDARKISLDSTFNVMDREPARRTRARSGSRCRSHSRDEENRDPVPVERVSRPSSQRTSRSSSTSRHSELRGSASPRIRDRIPSAPTVPHSVMVRPEANLTSWRSSTQQSRNNYPIRVDDSDNDSVFTTSSSLQTTTGSGRGGALQLELTLHEARNLPLVEDRRGSLVPPMAYVQMLGRDEQVVSTISPPSQNPVWNWKGKFVISSERGNLLIKVLHKQDDMIGVIGIVTLSSPLQSFSRTEYEISLLSSNASGTAVLTLSLQVKPLRGMLLPCVVSSSDVRDEYERVPSSLRPPSSTRPEADIMWEDDRQQPRLHHLRSRNSHSTSPRPPVRRIPFEEISYKLQDDVDDLLQAVNRLGK